MYILLKNLELLVLFLNFSILPNFPNYSILRNPVISFLVYKTGIYMLPPNTPSPVKILFSVPSAYSTADKIRNVYLLNKS